VLPRPGAGNVFQWFFSGLYHEARSHSRIKRDRLIEDDRKGCVAVRLFREVAIFGDWSQLPDRASDAYATGQAVYALRVGARLEKSHPAVERGLRYLLTTQLADGTWHVRRRAFPFQPTTIRSGFPHGRDPWISAAATSWAVMALSMPDSGESLALKR
jgi:hypothetical protein